MAQWGNQDQLSDAPKFAVQDNGQTGQDQFGNTVFGVDVTESAVARGDGKGSVPPGWVKVTTGTGGRAGRVTHETLVAIGSIQPDAVDFVGAPAAANGAADDASFPDV